MNAIQPTRPTLKPLPPNRRATRKTRPSPRHQSIGIAAETTAKLVVNVVLSAAAIAALIQLLPFQFSQQAKLQELQTEVQRTEKRVNRLQLDFSRGFDPQQAKSVMQEQSHRVDPSQRQIVLLENSPRHEESPPLP